MAGIKINPIKITLAGGLGNQLFQISAGLYIEKNLNRPIIYDISNLNNRSIAKVGNYTRNLQVSELIQANCLIKSKYAFNQVTINGFLKRILNSDSVLFESENNPFPLKQINKNTSAIYGYFQDHSLVENIWPNLHQNLKNSKKFNQIIESRSINRIGVHLRFGDYSEDPSTRLVHGLTGQKFYATAINKFIGENREISEVLCISDDKAKAFDFMRSLGLKQHIQIVSHEDPFLDLIEIVKSSNIVISNSTFSWWGAYFANKLHNAKVIYPRPWFANSLDPDLPIYNPNWFSLTRDYSTS